MPGSSPGMTEGGRLDLLHTLNPCRAHHDGFDQDLVGVEVEVVRGLGVGVACARAPGARVAPVLDAVALDPVAALFHQVNRAGKWPGMDLEVFQRGQRLLS